MEKRNSSFAIVVGLVIAGLLITVLFLLYQNTKLQNNSIITPSITPTIETTPTIYNSEETPTPSSSVAVSNATVIFESEASFSAGEKDHIKSKIIDPFLMYYADQYGADHVKTLTISVNDQPSKTEFPYLAKYIFEDGVNGGFVISKTQGNIDWWIPECMGPCPFSDNFRNKYPEISKIAG